ncbi:carboxymuconolactone decarboxylase family protein [Pseudonocardia sp.]|uniref:carboxymuconolactone decarboxylase family protein n=1 Tax=Pseudonocardia sp. TaxID=60912 RepID=UPI0031FC952C
MAAADGPAQHDRMPPVPDADMTPAQQAALAAITAGPRGGVGGPFVPLLRSPELMTRLQRTGEYLRFASPLERRLFEMAVLFVARWWDQEFEWSHHHPLALAAGLDPAIVDAIAHDRRPKEMDEAAAAVWDLLDELHRTKGVTDATYARVLAQLGEAGVVELVGTAGYYTTLAMTMNTARTPAPGGPFLPPRHPATEDGR